MKPRGIRNNNAGNIRGSDRFTWLGEMGRDDKNFVIFDKPENGIRAMSRIIDNYERFYGINTLEGIIHRWAPPDDNNDTESYIRHAESELKVSRYLPLDGRHRAALIKVIIKHENGVQPYSDKVINDGIAAA